MSQLDLNVLDKQIDSDPYQILEFKGTLDKANIDDVKPALNNFAENFSDQCLIFDMRYFEFINSEGVGLMVSLFYMLQKKNIKLVLLKLQPQVMDVCEAMGLTKIVPTYELLEEVIKNI